MVRAAAGWAMAVGLCAAAARGQAPAAQSSPAPATQNRAPFAAQIAPPALAPGAPAVAGGKLHGVVKSGNVPLPGVTVTAQNTLTGKRYATTTDIAGAWSMAIPQNGRYVIRSQFAGFSVGSGEALLNASSHDQAVNFDILLASRAAAQARQQGEQADGSGDTSAAAQAIRQLAGNGPQSLSLTSAMTGGTEAGAESTGTGSGAALPSIAGNSDFAAESVNITGQSGQVSPLAGVNMDQLRDTVESLRAQMGGDQGPGGGVFGPGGGGFGGGGGFAGGFGGGRGGRGNFRGFNPGQPHGAIFWMGSNSALNAEPFSLRGQPQEQPASGTNRFGLTFMSAPYIPHLTKPSGKDSVFLTLSGQRSSNPVDDYATVPTQAEENGDFSAAGLPAIYDPTTGLQFVANGNPGIASGTPNVIPTNRIASQATALLKYYPAPNLSGANAVDNYNYHLLTTAQTNSAQAGIRYNRSFGANASQGGFGGGRGGGGGGGRRSQQNQGLRQSMNVNYNWSHNASDLVNVFPQLGGKSASDSYALQAGYTVGYHKVTNIFNANWNRSNSHSANFFTNTSDDVASLAGIAVPNQVPLNYGLPSLSLSNLSGLQQQQPSFSLSQTISFSETLSWIHGKHNLRFGGDYRRVHRDFLAGSNATGAFTFTGLFTEDGAGDATTGTALADFLLGLPQSATLNSSLTKSYLRDNVFDGFALDDWRMLPSLTVNFGVRYEFFAPYTEKFGHLADVATNPDGAFTSETEQVSGAPGLPASLVFPYHKAFAPRLGLAWRVPKIKQFVVRAGYGVNYTVGEYGSFATTMSHLPPFTNEQTNTEAVGNTASSACAQTVPMTCFTLANGFPAPAAVGNYALNPHYGLPYVQAWNVDVQKTLPWGLVMNLGYNGSRSDHLDVKIAPRAVPGSPLTNPANLIFDYDEAEAFYKMNSGTVRVNKRLGKGVAMGANYQYMHAIDNASGVNGSSGSVAQNWQDIAGEEGHSGLDVRQQVNGTYLYELPFGKDKFWFTTGTASHILEGFSVSGTYTIATGSWLSPTYTLNTASVECGTSGALRANRVPGVSVTAGGGSLHEWFNPAAYSEPAPTLGYCNGFGNAPRNSIEGPGKISNNMALSKTVDLGENRGMEIRATISNVFNTVQYSGVNTTEGTPTFGQVSSVAGMRSFQFTARFRF